MKLNKNLGMILLSVWLIVHALITLLNFSFSGLSTVMACVALLCGIVILLFDKATPSSTT